MKNTLVFVFARSPAFLQVARMATFDGAHLFRRPRNGVQLLAREFGSVETGAEADIVFQLDADTGDFSKRMKNTHVLLTAYFGAFLRVTRIATLDGTNFSVTFGWIRYTKYTTTRAYDES